MRTPMDCAACGESLWEHAGGRLAPDETARVEAHLGECAACRAEAEAIRQACSLLRRQPAPEPPANTPGALRERVRAGYVSVGEQAQICRLLAGVWNPSEGAAAALRRAASGAAGVRLARVLLDLSEAAQGGDTLAEALQRRPYILWPPILALARQGEATGKLSEMLTRLAGILEGELALRHEVTATADAPAFVALGVGAGVGVLAELRRRREGPGRRAAYFGALSAGGTLAALTLRREVRRGARVPWLRRASRQVRGFRETERLATWADVAASLAGLAAPDIAPAEILRTAAEAVDDPEVCTALRAAAGRAEQVGLAGALRAEPEIPLAFAEAAALGEEAGEPEALFGALAGEYRNEIARDVGRVTAWTKPAFFALGGAFLGATAGALVGALRAPGSSTPKLAHELARRLNPPATEGEPPGGAPQLA